MVYIWNNQEKYSGQKNFFGIASTQTDISKEIKSCLSNCIYSLSFPNRNLQSFCILRRLGFAGICVGTKICVQVMNNFQHHVPEVFMLWHYYVSSIDRVPLGTFMKCVCWPTYLTDIWQSMLTARFFRIQLVILRAFGFWMVSGKRFKGSGGVFHTQNHWSHLKLRVAAVMYSFHFQTLNKQPTHLSIICAAKK